MPASPSSLRVLYVDDDAHARASFERLVRRRGGTVESAASGEEALVRIAGARYDVVATDLMMPGLDGLELIDRLHAIAPDTAVVLCTGASVLDLPTESASARSIACVIRKPWEADDVYVALTRAAEAMAARSGLPGPAAATQPQVLVLEDNPGDAKLVEKMLGRVWRSGYGYVWARRLSEALDQLYGHRFDVLLADLSLPDARGLDAVARLQAVAPGTPIIVLSGMSDEALAVQAVQVGAQDYLVKSQLDERLLRRSVQYAIERKRSEVRLLQLAHFDQLTGLANRTLFRERAAQATARARRGGASPALVLLDLDNFKHINDTLGHGAGDELLVVMARRLIGLLPESDTVARLGGDEFAIIIDDGTTANVTDLASRIIAAVAAPVELTGAGREVQVTASLGISMYPANGEDVDVLLTSADSAMYRAKRAGRNNSQFFDAPTHARALRRLQLERELRGALDRDEFALHFQPQTSVTTGAVVGVEALLRWNHRLDGVISPAAFVPILEETKLIIAVGAWVLRGACAQARAWQRQGFDGLRVAVNVAPLQLQAPDFVDLVVDALCSTGLAPAALELEITEGMVMGEDDHAMAALRRLRAMGVRIAIDDFGTGYSSLARLAEFPVDVLKVDRSFVSQSGDAGQGATITAAIIQLGHALGLEVVAEGVEQAAQLEFLRVHGCETMQGYFRARPMAGEACTTWLARAMGRDAPAAVAAS